MNIKMYSVQLRAAAIHLGGGLFVASHNCESDECLRSRPCKPHLSPADQSATNIQSTGPVRLIIVCAVLLAVAIVAGTATFLSNLRNRLLRENERELTSTALILSTQIESFLNAVEKVQKAVLDHLVDIGNRDGDVRESGLSRYGLHLKLRDQAPACRSSARSPSSTTKAR